MATKNILMIHGMWGGGWYWKNFSAFFEKQGYRCLTPDLRYHSLEAQESPPPALGTTSVLDYASDMQQLIEQLKEKPIVMGHSMGGLIAQILASRGLVEKMVLLAPAAPAGIMALTPSVIKSFSAMLFRAGFWKKAQKISFDKAVYAMLHLIPAEEQKEIYQKFVYESGRAAAEIGFWPLDKNRATRVNPRKVTCPTLVIAGSEDRITPASIIRKIARRYPQAKYKQFKRHAHWLIAEPGWQEVASYIARWLGN